MKFTLRQLQVFVAIAHCGSVSQAASDLALSQSATSTALAELERQFYCQLFDRVGKRLMINGLGRQALPEAVSLLEQADDLESLLSGQRGFARFELGATLTIGNYLGPLLLSHFMERYPECRVGLQVHNTAAIVDAVARCELDLGLIEGSCQHPDIVVEPWLEDELVVFCAPDHPLAGAGFSSAEALAQEVWILREPGSGTRLTFEQGFRHVSTALRVRLELAHTEAIKRAVEMGLGVGCISRLALREAFRRGTLVPVETPDLDFRRTFTFIWHRRKYQAPAVRAFLELCRELTAGARRSDEIRIRPPVAGSEQDQAPDRTDQAEGDELSRAAHVLGRLG